MLKRFLPLSAALMLTFGFTACDKEVLEEIDEPVIIETDDTPALFMLKDAGFETRNVYLSDNKVEFPVSILKTGGYSPATEANIRVATPSEFEEIYKEKYGWYDSSRIFMMPSRFFYLASDNDVKADINGISHVFNNVDDSYFTAKLVLDNFALADWHDDLEIRAESDASARDTLNRLNWNADEWSRSYIFVPLILSALSSKDSVDADAHYLVLNPKWLNPEVKVSVTDRSAFIVEQDRTKLMDEASDYRNGIYEPQVIFSIPCANPYGFNIKYNIGSEQDIVSNYSNYPRGIDLTYLPQSSGSGQNYSTVPVTKDASGRYVEDSQYPKHSIMFPPGVTEVRLPLSFYRKTMNIHDEESNYAVPFKITGIEWLDESTPERIKKSLTCKEGYTFFVGYRVGVAPLEMDGGCVIGANDPELTEGSFAALFDGNLSTFYHSAWSDESRKDRNMAYGSYLDFEIPSTEPVNAVAFKFTARIHSNPHGPKVIKLYYSNSRTEVEREADWKPIYMGGTTEINVSPIPRHGSSGSGQVTWLGGVRDGDWIQAPETFRYMRMCVIKNSFDESLTTMGTKAVGYWNLAELRIYGTKL